MDDDRDCSICANTFNQSTRARVSCFACPLGACKECVRTFLTTNEKPPQCMGCGVLFQQGFLVRHLNRSWVQDVYGPYHKTVLLKGELSKIPESVPYAEAELERRRLTKQNEEYEARVFKLHQQIVRYRNAQQANRLRILGQEVPPGIMNDLVDGGPLTVDKAKKFVMRCPAQGCNGFLSTAYKCAICSTDTCSDCLTVLAGPRDAHRCVESDRLSADAIKKDTRPCPTCGQRIYKISGCDQMFCTSVNPGGAVCGTAFSWKTGAVERGTIHNPHFYELQRTMGAAAPRNIGDVLCGGVPNVHDLLRTLALDRFKAYALRVRIQTVHARVSELTQYTVNDLRLRMRQLADCHRLRIPFILNEMTEAQLGDAVFKKERELHKTTDTYHVLDVLSNTAIDVFRDLTLSTPHSGVVQELLNSGGESVAREIVDNIEQRLRTLDQVRKYCNDQLVVLSVNYSCTVQTYDENFAKHSHKYSMKAARSVVGERD